MANLQVRLVFDDAHGLDDTVVTMTDVEFASYAAGVAVSHRTVFHFAYDENKEDYAGDFLVVDCFYPDKITRKNATLFLGKML